MKRIFLSTLLLTIMLVACAPTVTTVTKIPPTETATPTAISTSSPVPTITPTLTPAPTLAPMTNFMNGLVYYPAVPGGNSRSEVEWMLENLVVPTGANWIKLHVECNQRDVRSVEVYCDPLHAISDEEYTYLVKTAHRLGMRVMSEHIIATLGWGQYWHGDIGKFYTEEQWGAWFKSYGEMILRYAKLAEEVGTDYLVIGPELDSTAHREKEWRELIAQVRAVYHGKVTVAFDEERPLRQAKFWDALDSIGAHPYYLSLPGVIDPSVEQLDRAYEPYAERLKALSEKWNKPILISEIGFWSVHTQTQNYNYLDSSNKIDLQEQSDLFQAVFDTFHGKDWVEGIFCYAFEGWSNYPEPWNIHNDFLGKPSENVIRSFFGAPPLPTSTPIIPPPADLNQTEVIYRDRLNSAWSNYPPEGRPDSIQFDQSDIAMSGNAIKVNLYQFWSLDFRNDQVDFNKYQWLDFDLYVEPKNLPKVYTIGVTLRGPSYQPAIYRVELLQSQFIEGGTLQPGTWQHVQIPLDVFGPRLSRYVIISIDHPGASTADLPLLIYVDNVVLRGK
ncbi:MAG: hypothetical protein LC099_10785 [Anaerolineales bacterium]|nr:hypothetical protein [Anaerolineales bacterium]